MVPTGTAGGDSQPVLLITGTSSGIGLSTSVVAAKHGYRVVATMRNLDSAGPPTGELQEPPAMAPLLSMMAPDTADVLARGIGVGDPCLG